MNSINNAGIAVSKIDLPLCFLQAWLWVVGITVGNDGIYAGPAPNLEQGWVRRLK